MGYYTRSNGIESFEPDDTPDKFYIPIGYASIDFSDLLNRIKTHFGDDCTFDDCYIEAELIHTDCIGYDMYDRGDWTQYLIISKKKVI